MTSVVWASSCYSVYADVSIDVHMRSGSRARSRRPPSPPLVNCCRQRHEGRRDKHARAIAGTLPSIPQVIGFPRVRGSSPNLRGETLPPDWHWYRSAKFLPLRETFRPEPVLPAPTAAALCAVRWNGPCWHLHASKQITPSSKQVPSRARCDLARESSAPSRVE
jgi:hypothetical protein